MEKFITGILCLLFSASLLAQKDKQELKVKYGKISEEELQMTHYAKDSAAAAVILFDKGYTHYEWRDRVGFVVEHDRHVRIKIFKKDAYDQANIRIPYRGDAREGNREKIFGLKATCYNVENGKVVETDADSKNMFDEKLARAVRVKKITIPNVKEGSIIEYKYTITDENATHVPEWRFQDMIPTVWSEYETRIPQYFVFAAISQGMSLYAVNKEDTENTSVSLGGGDRLDFQQTTTRRVQKDVPAFKIEKYMTAPIDYLSRVVYQFKTFVPPPGTGFVQNFTSSWAKLGNTLMEDEDFEGAMKKTSATAELSQNAVGGATTPKDKLAAIYQYIGSNFTTKDYSSYYLTEPLKDILKNKKGTEGELNLLLINALRVAGVEAYPVLVSHRSHGRLNQAYPLMERVSHVIAYVQFNEKDGCFVDMDEFPSPIGLLPEDDLNGEGFLIKEKGVSGWVEVRNTVNSRQGIVGVFKVGTEGGLSGNLMLMESGYPALESRQLIKNKKEEGFRKVVLGELLDEGKLTESSIEKPEDFTSTNFKGQFKLETTAFTSAANDKIYISPLLNFAKKENPFKSPERIYDVDYGYPLDETFNLTFNLPEGYRVEELPKNAAVGIEDGTLKYTYMAAATPTDVKITVRFQMKRSLFAAEEYVMIRQLYTEMIAKMGEQIVLAKADVAKN
jgi:hypothetical protein